MAHSQRWNTNRLYQQTRCPCEHCCKSSNICNYCKDWSEKPIDWQTSHPLNIRCNKCTNAYHLKCLPFDKRKANSWHSCPDIEQKCSKYLHFFSLLHKRNNNKQATKYERMIQQKYNGIYPNKKLKIAAHFCGFHYNQWTFLIQDCAEILLKREAPGIGRIIDIFLTDQNESYVLIQWYWKRSDFSSDKNIPIEKELLFTNTNDDNSIHIIKIGRRINGKVAVMDNFEQYKYEVKKRDTLKREKTERINQEKNHNNFPNICLVDKSIQFDKIFYSCQSCDGNVNNKKRAIYPTDSNDTNQKRMEIQKEILIQNTNKQIQNTNTNRKRKRKFNNFNVIQTQKTKKRKIENKCDAKKNTKNKKCDANTKNEIENKNKNNNNNNNNNNKISSTVAREAYDELVRENDKLKADIARLKQYKEEILLLQASNAKFQNKIDCYEKNKQMYITKINKLKQEKDELCKKGREKLANLRQDHKKMDKSYENKIGELERINKKLKKTLQKQNDDIAFFRKARAERNNTNPIANTNTNTNANAPVYHISNISPVDPRINRHKTNQMFNQEMNPNELRQRLNR